MADFAPLTVHRVEFAGVNLQEASALAGVIGLVVTLATLVGNLLARWLGGVLRRAQLKRLAVLRREGVDLRNEGLFQIKTPDDLAEWVRRRDIWHREALPP